VKSPYNKQITIGGQKMTIISQGSKIPNPRICKNCNSAIPRSEGFYGFAHFDLLSKNLPFDWITGLYKAHAGPQQPTRKSEATARFDVCTDCLIPFLNRFMKQEEAGQAETESPSDFLAGCTPDERSYCVRLVRVLRDNYWITTLVTAILDKEATNKNQISMKWLTQLLKDLDNIEQQAYNAQRLGNNWSNHPILRAIRKEWGDQEIAEYQSERRIAELIESAHRR